MKNSTVRHVARLPITSRAIGVVLLALGGCSSDIEAVERGDVPDGDESIGVAESAFSKKGVGSGSVFAPIPTPPGLPEGVVVVRDRVYVSGPATFGTAGFPPSQVLIFDLKTGAPKGSITIQGELTQFEHALSCITADGDGRLYVLSTQLGVVRLTPSGNGFVQDIYSPPPPDLPMCTSGSTGPCSPTSFDGPPLVNDLAFDRDGNLYITDSFQATIFRVPRGGGPASIWFQSPELEGIPFFIGLNGLALSKDQKHVHEFGPGDEPDGIALGVTGKLYVALTGTNAVSVIGPNGNEVDRFTGPTGSPIPYDGPASIAFDGHGSILVTNHAPYTNNAAHFAVLEQYVADHGFPLPKPHHL
jgi:DNA-binding beta-propeller fold protein YncE